MAALQKVFTACRSANLASILLRASSARCFNAVNLHVKHQSTNVSSVAALKLFLGKVEVNQCAVAKKYSSKPPLDKDSIEKRVMLCLHLYDKINPETVTLESRFKEDLSLDSLDHVEIVMAIEDEFGFEIPDQDAEHLITPAKIVQYIMDKEDIYEPAT